MRRENDYDCTMKILFLGNSGGGKSCLIRRYTEDTFMSNSYCTIGVDFKLKNLHIDDLKVKMQVWDTAGQDRFRTITSSYYRGADGIIIVFDLCDRASFEGVQTWITEMRRYTEESCQSILIGNKSDLSQRRQIATDEASQYAERLSIPYFETSAREGTNVSEAFEKIARMIINSRSGNKLEKKNPEQKLKKEEIHKKMEKHSSCC